MPFDLLNLFFYTWMVVATVDFLKNYSNTKEGIWRRRGLQMFYWIYIYIYIHMKSCMHVNFLEFIYFLYTWRVACVLISWKISWKIVVATNGRRRQSCQVAKSPLCIHPCNITDGGGQNRFSYATYISHKSRDICDI